MVLAAFAGFLVAGCGGSGSTGPAPNRDVTGEGFIFRAPRAWVITRSSHVVSAARSTGSTDVISVSLFRIARPVRPVRWARVVRELDRVASDYARRLPGRLVERAGERVAGRRARRYEFAYRRGSDDLGQRLVFLFEGRREFQLLCRWKAPAGEEIASACDGLAAGFRPR